MTTFQNFRYGKITSKERTPLPSGNVPEEWRDLWFPQITPCTDTEGGKIVGLVTVINVGNVFSSGNALN